MKRVFFLLSFICFISSCLPVDKPGCLLTVNNMMDYSIIMVISHDEIPNEQVLDHSISAEIREWFNSKNPEDIKSFNALESVSYIYGTEEYSWKPYWWYWLYYDFDEDNRWTPREGKIVYFYFFNGEDYKNDKVTLLARYNTTLESMEMLAWKLTYPPTNEIMEVMNIWIPKEEMDL